MVEFNTETVKSVARVITKIKENEGDSDHISILNSTLDRLWDLYGEEVSTETDDVKSKDVEVTINFLNEYAPSRNERGKYLANNQERHPDRVFAHAIDFVDNESRYLNGCLPSFRDWGVEYIHNGEVIETRKYEYDDEIPLEPVIDDVRYECESTDRSSNIVKVYVSKNPLREDVDIVIHAEGDDFINMEAHDGPNVKNEKAPISMLSNEFNWGMLGEKKIIINENPEDVVEFIESKGWEYEYSDERYN